MSNPDPSATPAVADPVAADPKAAQQPPADPGQGKDPTPAKDGDAADPNKPDDAAKAEADAKAAAEAKAKEEAENAVPAEYSAFNVPEGYTLEGERLEFAKTLFKELGLSQARAQKAVEAFCKADGENAATRQAFLDSERQQRIENWGQEAKDLLGVKYDETVADARIGVAAVNDPELLKAFDAEGWGNHPRLLLAFAKLGQLAKSSGLKGMGEEGVKKDRSEIPIENRFYPNMK